MANLLQYTNGNGIHNVGLIQESFFFFVVIVIIIIFFFFFLLGSRISLLCVLGFRNAFDCLCSRWTTNYSHGQLRKCPIVHLFVFECCLGSIIVLSAGLILIIIYILIRADQFTKSSPCGNRFNDIPFVITNSRTSSNNYKYATTITTNSSFEFFSVILAFALAKSVPLHIDDCYHGCSSFRLTGEGGKVSHIL